MPTYEFRVCSVQLIETFVIMRRWQMAVGKLIGAGVITWFLGGGVLLFIVVLLLLKAC